MENASKALLMAGGILIALLTISLLVIMFRSIAGTQRDDNINMAELTTTEFNNQFSSYNTDRVRGSELLTCLNRALDYDARKTFGIVSDRDRKQAEYKPIEITMKINTPSDFVYRGYPGGPQIFETKSYILALDSSGKNLNNSFKEIIGEMKYNDAKSDFEFTDSKIRTLENIYRSRCFE